MTSPEGRSDVAAASHQFFRVLTVERCSNIATGVVRLDLVDPTGADLPPWKPGAHIDVMLPSGPVRQYSLCGPVENRKQYEIAVLRVATGRGGSREIHDEIRPGLQMKIFGPRNDFELVDAPSYLLLAGGIGITPLISMARELTRRGDVWSCMYGADTNEHMAYRDELEHLAGNQLELVPRNERGLPDLGGAIRRQDPGCAVYCCGPEPMIARVERLCARRVGEVELHVERFTEPSAPIDMSRPDDQSFEVELRRSNKTITVGARQTLLAALREILPSYSYSCLEGECGTCMAKVLEGVVDHRDKVLTEHDKTHGKLMMPCVSRVEIGQKLVLDL